MISPEGWAALYQALAAAGRMGEYHDDNAIGVTQGEHGSLIAWKVSVIAGPYKMRLILWKEPRRGSFDTMAQGPELFITDDGTIPSDQIVKHLEALVALGAKVEAEPSAAKRVADLEHLCGEAYQLLGELGSEPHQDARIVKVLDALAAAANGDPIPGEVSK